TGMRYTEIIAEDLSANAINKTIAIRGDKLEKALNVAKSINLNRPTAASIAFTFEAKSFSESFLLFLDGISPDTGYVAWLLKCFLA
ncbi:hypothetical protein ACI3PL_26680, partial [Lacticaseibacillus paracasei]